MFDDSKLFLRDNDVLEDAVDPAVIDDDVLRGLFVYWSRLRVEQEPPQRDQIDPAEVVQALPFMMLVDVLDNGERFRFRLAGSDVATGVNPTGMILNDAVPPGAYHTHVISLYQTAAARKSALYTVSAYGDVTLDGHAPPTVSRLFLPLSWRDDSANCLLVGQRWLDNRYNQTSLWELYPLDIAIKSCITVA